MPKLPPGVSWPVFAAQAVATLSVGTAGGALAYFLGVPLAWMIGAMLANAILALANVRIAGHGVMLPMGLRMVMVPVLGVMLGASFRPDIFHQMADWWITMLGLIAFVGIAATLVYQMYRRLFGLERPTAYFAAIPGGLVESAILGEMAGGDLRMISLIHFCRIIVAVLVIPFALQAFYGPVGSAALPVDAFDTALGPFDILLLAGAGVIGLVLGRALHLPGAPVSGPMLLSALVHITGLTAAQPPSWLIVTAQVVMGSALGARFLGYPLPQVWRGVRAAVAAVAVMLSVTLALSLVLAPFITESLTATVLAYAPGGLAEMSLIALSLQISVAFVAAHHVVRIFLAVFLPPLVYRLVIDRNAQFKRVGQ